jgi:hypothetical protein
MAPIPKTPKTPKPKTPKPKNSNPFNPLDLIDSSYELMEKNAL